MKIACLFIQLLLISIQSIAQPTTTFRRNIRFHSLGKDSIEIPFNEDYFTIEDSCAKIYRHGHFSRERKFVGPFTDVSKDDAVLIVAQGNYDAEGKRNGDFISHYLNGNLQAKGTFKNNVVAGICELYFQDGKPKAVLEATDNDIKVRDLWDAEGKKIVDNGNGNYFSNLGGVWWNGKLVNGKPDGTWKATATGDRGAEVIVKENFKDGKFQKGSSSIGTYNDASHIYFISDVDFPFLNAEKMQISFDPCSGAPRNGAPRNIFIDAHYSEGNAAFSQRIKDLVSPFLGTVDLKPYNTEVEFITDVSDKGNIGYFTAINTFDQKMASGLAKELMKLPGLEPATLNGKPVSQKIVVTFKFMSGYYSFRYRFLPLDK